MDLARVAIALLLLLVDCYCGPYGSSPAYRFRKNFNKASSYHMQRNFNGCNFHIRSRENSFEGSPYYYPVPKSSPFSYEVSSDESNEVETPLADGGKIIFSYDECDAYSPSNWGKISENCLGYSQSPVNLHTYIAKPSAPGQPLIIDGYDSIPSSVSVENSGHSAAFRFKFRNDKPVRFLGGPLKVAYILDNVHFHWGEDDHAGSEHLLNSRRYSAEVHLVTYNSKYASFEEASTQSKGLAVIAFFYELDNRNGASCNPFVKLLSKIIEAETSYDETSDVFSIGDLIKKRQFRYVSYKGSLTTPNCLETVTWLVSTTPLKISSSDLAEFRKLRDEKGKLLTKNSRPLQKLNKRKLISY